MWDIKNCGDTKLVGALGKLKSYGLLEINRKPFVEEPRKEYRKVITLVGPRKDDPMKILKSVVKKRHEVLKKLNGGSKKIRVK